MIKSGLVTVKRCTNPFESAFLKDYLERNGIPARDTGMELRAFTGRYGLLSRGCQVQVRAEDAARARALLEHPPEAPLDFAAQDTADIAAPLFDARGNLLRCPNCGSDNVEEITISPIIRMLAIILLLGLPLLVARKRAWVCRDCDWDSTRYAEGVPEKDADPDA